MNKFFSCFFYFNNEFDGVLEVESYSWTRAFKRFKDWCNSMNCQGLVYVGSAFDEKRQYVRTIGSNKVYFKGEVIK